MILKVVFLVAIVLQGCTGQTGNGTNETEHESDKIWKSLIRNGQNPISVTIEPEVQSLNETKDENFPKSSVEIEQDFMNDAEHIDFSVNTESDELMKKKILKIGDLFTENFKKDYKSDSDTKNSRDTLNTSENERNNDHSNSSRLKVSEESVELLEDVDSYFALRLKSNNSNVSSNKFYLRTKYGSKIIENPSYNEPITKKPEPGQRSLVIIFDGTGSMIDDLKQLTEGAEAIISEITQREKNPIYNYIFVPFRDPYVGPKLVTRDLNRFLAELRSLPLFGGGDCPESAIGGINLALESILPKSFIFVFTDATANDFGLDKTTIDLIQKHQATLTFLLTGFCKSKRSDGYYVYEKLAALSNGQVFNLQKTDIKEVLESVRTSLDKDLVPIGYVYSKDSGTHSIDIPVDYNLKELTVSVAGENPNITLKDPNEVKRTDVNELLNLSNLKVVNVQDPIPGKWNIETEADSEHSVRLTALSNLNFKFGFSRENPKNINETNLNPIKKILNVLSIEPSDFDLVGDLTSVDLIPFDYNPDEIEHDIQLPLKYVRQGEGEGDSSIYVTEPFRPPMEMFKIYVKGFDSKGNPLKHLISTAIKAVDGEKPKISTQHKYVEFVEGSDGEIVCEVDTSYPAAVSWKRNDNKIYNVGETSESSVFGQVFNKIQLEDGGLYVCIVENEHGRDEQAITVIVQEDTTPLNVKLMQPYMISKENDVDYQINCYVSPPENVNYTWLFEGSEIKDDSNFEISADNLIIKRIHRSDAGNYTCKANNKRVSGIDTAYLDVLYGSEILSPDDEWHTANPEENLRLDCSAVGNPTPTVEWTLPPGSNQYLDENVTVQNFKVEVGGWYSCKVSNGIGGEKIKKFYVDLREKPKIQDIVSTHRENDKLLQFIRGDEDTYKVFEGFTGSFFCNATGNPEPLTHWIKRSEENESGEETFSDDEILLIDITTVSDAGNYVCIAENELGVDTKSINLYVVAPPKMKSIEDAVVMVEKGQSVILNCDVIGIPFPTISWSFNNNSLDENDVYYTFENTSLMFPANLKDSGIYECLAQNEAGHAIKKIVLLVYVPPTIYPPYDEVTTSVINSNIILACTAEGYPKPSISWFKNGLPIQNEKNIFSNENGELVLMHNELSDEGMYTCQAHNQHGTAQKNFYLNINYAPEIVTELSSHIKLLPSESVTLNCTASGNPAPLLLWTKNNETIQTGTLSSVLTLNNLEHQNISGDYKCLAQNLVGTDQKFVEVIGIGKPTIDETPINSNKLTNATLFEDIELYCPIKNAENYVWYKNGEELFGETNEVLQLTSISWNEHGNYTCIGKNEVGSVEYTQQVVVWTTPHFTDDDSYETNDDNVFVNQPMPKNIELKLGENVTLKCTPQGYPEPKIEWRKDNNVLSHDPELQLTNVQIAHAGDYVCRAENVFGENEITYKITVQVPPTSQVPKDNWIEISENEDLKLDCSLVGNPWPLIYWTKNGVNMSEFQEVLEINDPKIEDSGEYKCIATNFLGEDEITFHVDILAPPKFISPKEEIKIREQNRLELECVVVANPIPIVAWSFNNKVLWSTSSIPMTEGDKIVYTDHNGNPLVYMYPNETISNDIPNTGQYGKLIRKDHTLKALLIIEDPKKKKSGLYKCHSINSLGSQEQTFNVQINYPPTLKGSENEKRPIVNVTVLEDLPLILYCPWHGNPSPKITWTKDNQPIHQHDTTLSSDMKTLTIFNANLNRHSGEFVCTAVNEIGTNQKNFYVKILVPPKFETNNNVIEEYMVPYTHVIGQKTVLECPVTGNPPPTIFWLQQTDDEKSDKDFEILTTNSSQLILDDIKSSGVYSCYANNSLGFIEKKYSVEVQRIPFINSDIPKQQTFKEYQTITLQCPAEGTPKPIISWYKNGRSVEDVVASAQFSYDKTILKIPNARKEHSGTYTCFATNSIGETRRDTQVAVKTPVIWSNWESWTPCSKSCGTGTKSRRRRCIQLNGEPASTENECKGANYESELCEMLPCPIDGGWSEWTQWTACSKTCTDINDTFKPSRKRYRECNSPAPMNGGRHCVGVDYEEELCNSDYCPVNGGWSDWTTWSPCSVSCGTGRKERHRKCNNPVPAFGGNSCKGRSSDVTYCYPNPCAINGGWSEWSAWSECSQTCGTGLKKRSRTCTNPEPKYGGEDCLGENMEIVRCRKRKCPNSSLLKSFHVKNPYGPAAEYDVPNLHFQGDFEDDDQIAAPQEPQYQYALGSTSQFNLPSGIEQKNEYMNPAGMKVVVTLKNYKPIDKDTKEISLYPGIAPFKIERIVPCPFGFELNENNQCKDIDECQMGSVCEENESCRNIDGGFICSCQTGYRFDDNEGKCVDTDECADKKSNDCSHACKNTEGSYTCSCPGGYMLNPDKRGCGPDPLYSGDGFMADFAFTNSTETNCFEGYQLVDGICQDINECLDMEHDCGYDQRCLNTKGSYLCIPTPCPENYMKDERSGLCILMCNKDFECDEEVEVAEILTYTLLPLEKVKLTEPFHTLLSYDLERNVLIDTVFSLEKGKDSKLFRLETIEQKKGIAYLFATSKLRKEKLYNIRVVARSYDSKTFELIYITRFVIYLYLL